MQTKQIIFLFLCVAVLAALFFVLKPHQQTNSTATVQTVTNAAPTSTAAVTPVATTSDAKTFTIVTKDNKYVSGPETIQVTEGDKVAINITSNVAEELHLHGYDISVDLEPDKQATLSFTANLTGRFPYELEDAKADIGVLEVIPK